MGIIIRGRRRAFGNGGRKAGAWLWLLGVALGVVILVGIILAVLLLRRPAPPAQPTKGNPAAPITIEEFTDFRCGYCTLFALDIAGQLDRDYVETGRVKLVFRNFPVGGATSELAAQAGECAHEQGKFWAYHDRLFEESAKRRGLFGPEDLKGWAREVGLNGQSFDQCLDSGRYAEEVRADHEEGRSKGVRGTPTFFIGEEVLEGVAPYPQFKAMIDAELGQKE